MREIKHHEIPDAYARQTLALAEAQYAEPARDDYEWAEDNGISALDLDMALYPEDFVSETDMEAPDDRDRANLSYLDDLAQHSHTL